ncbi:hypothetical protein Tco_0514737 [Tanacetum coccineum]
MVAYLEKSKGSEGFFQIIDFLTSSHIHYALTESPTLYASTIEQFWQTAALCTTEEGLEDSEGLNTLPTTEIFEQLALIGSSPSLSPQTHPSTLQPQTIPIAEETTQMPHESPLHSVHSIRRDEGSLSLNELMVLCTSFSKKVKSLESKLHQTKQTYSTAFTKLIKRVKKLEHTIKTSQARRSFKVVLSNDEEEADDPSKHGRKIYDIDKDPTISLVQDEGTSWVQEDPEIHEKISDDTEVVLEEEEPTKLVEDQGSGEKGEKEVSTVGAEHSTVIPEVSTTAANLVYIRRSAEKRKDKGKAIMTEPEPEQTTKKLKLIQERASLEAAIRLQEQFNEEDSQRIARDAEIARQLQKEINIAEQEKIVTEDDQSHDINWNDPSVIRFYAQQNRPFSKKEIRKNMCMYPKNQSGYKMSYFKGMSYEDIRPIFERKTGERSVSVEEPKDKELVKPPQEEIQEIKILLPEEGMHVEALQTKYPLIDWEIHSEDTMKYDLVKLWELIKERFNTTKPIDDKERELWVELKRLFEPDTDDLMKLQSHMYDLLTWRLYDTCGVHHVSIKTGLDMFMLVEKDYPLIR